MKQACLCYYAIGKIDKETLKQATIIFDDFFQEHEPIATVGLGISLDEIQRVKRNMSPETIYWKVNAHPLIFDVPCPLTRQDCIKIIADAGLPVPPKSSCWFCPYHSTRAWQDLRTHKPAPLKKRMIWKT